MSVPQDLLEALAAEAAATERVRDRTVVLGLLLTAGEHDHVGRARDELLDAAGEAAAASLLRAAVVAEVAEDWALAAGADASLRQLVEAAGDAHGAAALVALGGRLRAAAEEIESARADAEPLAQRRREEIAERRATVAQGGAQGYGPGSGSPPPAGFDGAL